MKSTQMTVEVYSDGTLVVQGNDQLEKILDPGATLLYTIEGESWEDCVQKYYDRKGWGKYAPLDI